MRETPTLNPIPGVAIARFLVDDDGSSQRFKGCGVVAEGIVELFPGRNFGVEGGLAKQVEQQLSLWKEMVPQVAGEARNNNGEDGYEVAIKFLNGALHSIASVYVRGDQLGLYFPIL